MNRLRVQGKSIPDVIVKHLTELLAISNAVFELCIKCEKLKQQQTHQTGATTRFSLRSDKDDGQFKVIEDLIKQVKNMKVDYLYYERIIYQQKYEELVRNLLTAIREICHNSKHQFFQSRKLQIEIIGLVVTTFDEIRRRVQKYLQDLSIQYPLQLSNYMEATLKLVKKIKVEKIVQKNKGEKIVFNFQSEPYQNNERRFEPMPSTETFKFSQVLTAATTRPSSTGKSNREGSKMFKMLQKAHPASIHENQQKKQDRNSHIVERVSQSKVIKMERCKTAKIQRRTRLDQKQAIRENFKNSKSLFDVLEEFKQSNGLITGSKRSSKRENKSRNQEKIESFASSQEKLSASKNKCFDEASPIRQKNKKKSRVARIQNPSTLWNKINPKKSQDNLTAFRPKSPTKHRKGKKMSQDGEFKQNYNHQFKRRNYQSDQQHSSYPDKKTNQLTKFNLYKKKTHKNKRHKFTKTVIVDTPSIAQEQIYQDRIPVLLLIKPPESSVREERASVRSSVKEPEKLDVQKTTKREIALMPRVIKTQKKLDLSESRQVSIENVENHQFRIQLDEINKIRSQFVDARWRNKIIGSQNQQNSVFFIEQGFLSQRENMRFQAHLIKMKENYGKQFHKEPFNIDYSIEQINNEKLKQQERQYTFEVENDWIKQKYHKPENIEGFDQLGLERVKQPII